MYGCVVIICLSGGFCSSVICSRIFLVQSGVRICHWWSHVSMAGLIVVMSAYNILGGGCCWFWCMYFERCGYLMVVSWCFGCVIFMIGENCLARCWYSGCNFIVFSIKYILHRFLCVVGCANSILGMGPGLVSISPQSISRRCGGNVL